MTNSPEMVFTIYALSKLGAVPALINSALRGMRIRALAPRDHFEETDADISSPDDTLIHCVKLPQAKLIISTPDLAPFAATAAQSLDGALQTVSLNLGSFRTLPTSPMPANIVECPLPDPTKANSIIPPPRAISDVGALIYTSGTTGKPKACSVKNAMICATSCATASDTSDPKKYFPVRTYSCMPLFHGTTFFIGLCYSVGNSGCFCMARKFSARNFWKDVTESRATRILYVGELCRYLLATPPGEYDRQHRCMVAAGNGMQKDVWMAFKQRFAIPEVREFYRSTEGLVKFDHRHVGNASGAGKVAFIGVLKRRLEADQFIVKFDYDNEMPYRDPKTGFCVLASLDEPGEAISKIKTMATYTDYHGNKKATEAKILRDVFEKGDVYQRSGDLLAQERSGWVHFVDRIGDTFRWKGENVSAGEIRAFISDLPHVQDAVVVGKQLKGYDGQAGVAAVSLDVTSADVEVQFIKGLYENLKRKGVPAYAFPRLIAVTNELVAVGDTFKHAKQVVKGIDWKPNTDGKEAANGRRYWLDIDAGAYRLLDARSWERIERGLAKL